MSGLSISRATCYFRTDVFSKPVAVLMHSNMYLICKNNSNPFAEALM